MTEKNKIKLAWIGFIVFFTISIISGLILLIRLYNYFFNIQP